MELNSSHTKNKPSPIHIRNRVNLQPYCEAIGEWYNDSVLCPICGNRTIIEHSEWKCNNCSLSGDVIDYVQYTNPGMSEQGCENHINKILGLSISSFDSIDANELMAKDLPPVETIIEPILTEGLYMIAGAPKSGKSWLMLDLAHHIARGVPMFGMNTVKADVAYLDLENSKVLSQYRLKKVTGGQTGRITIINDAETIGNGLESQLNTLLRNNPAMKVVIIDTFQRVRPPSSSKLNYAQDYRDAYALKKIADEYHAAIVLVHHTRKQPSEDPYELISGTNGLFGCADGAYVLIKENRQSPKARLYCTGRHMADSCLILSFNSDSCRWEFSGVADDFLLNKQDELITSLELLLADNSNHWCGTYTELANILRNFGIYKNAQALSRLLNSERLELEQAGIHLTYTRSADGKFITITQGDEE